MRLLNKQQIHLHFSLRLYLICLKSQPHECWEITPFSEEHSCQKGLFLDRVLISPRTEKALAAAVTKLMAPMARVACGDKEDSFYFLR